MIRKTILSGFAALVLCAPALVGAQAKNEAMKAPAMDMDAMMKKWAEYATPGASHKMLEKMTGSWTYTNKMWMDPSMPAQESKGTATNSMILGGRYLQQNYSGDFMGQPFEGLGLVGYDNFNKEFVSTWTDNTGTGIMEIKGTAAANGDLVFNGTMDDPVMGQKNKKFKEIVHWNDPDSYTLEMFDLSGPKEFKMMEITHQRAK